MKVVQVQFPQRGSAGRQSVRDDGFRLDGLVAQEALHQGQRGVVVPALLHHDIQHLALIVDGAREVRALAADVADHLVEIPCGYGAGRLSFKLRAICGPNLIVQQRMVS